MKIPFLSNPGHFLLVWSLRTRHLHTLQILQFVNTYVVASIIMLIIKTLQSSRCYIFKMTILIHCKTNYILTISSGRSSLLKQVTYERPQVIGLTSLIVSRINYCTINRSSLHRSITHQFVSLIIAIVLSSGIYRFNKVCDKITYPFPNFNGATVEVWECISYFIPHFPDMGLLVHTGIEVNLC